MRAIGSGRSAASVILVGLDNEQMGLVRETLAAEAVLPSTSVPYVEAVAVVKRARPDICIVSLGDSHEAPLALAQSLAREAPNVTLVALAKTSAADMILAAMRVGYKEYVVLPGDAHRLRQVVHEAAYAPSDDEDKGLVVTLVGAKGGVGTTVLTTHLAAELAAIHRVLCLDMDFAMGDCATLLDIAPRDTVHDLLAKAKRLDERMLSGSVTVHRTKLHLLAQPPDARHMDDVHPEDIYTMVNIAAKAYQYVLVDVGMRNDPSAEICLCVSDVILLVTTPDVVSVRDAFRRMRVLEHMGIEKDRIRLVVNRFRRGTFVSLDDIQRNLQAKVHALVSDDPKTVDTAINEGKLIREINRKADVSKDISRLVAMVADDLDEEDEDEDSAGGGGIFGSWFGRRG